MITNPIWVVNTRVTSARKKQLHVTETTQVTSTWETFQAIWKKEGIKGFWQGIIPALILVVNPSIQYMVFEQLRLRLEDRKRSSIHGWKSDAKLLNDFDYFALGALSKLAATAITYPYILVKTRLQIQRHRLEANQKDPSSHKQAIEDSLVNYEGTLDALQKILSQEGFFGLYKGLESKLSQSMLSSAILFMMKERLYKYTLKLVIAVRTSRRSIPILIK